MKASIIISFYNNLTWLKLVLAGLERQSCQEFEVLIADDGSKVTVVDEFKSILPHYSFSIHHLWHKDKGWQKNIILNKAVVASSSEYLIFMDGDCIPHRHFVKEHLAHKEKNFALAGRRLHLSAPVTEKLTPEIISSGYLETKALLKLYWDKMTNKGCEHWENGLYAPQWLRPHINKKDKGIVGSNFSVHKTDLLSINGFDERYLAPAVGEDTDLELRFRNNGMKIRSIKHLAIQYHLYHKTLHRPSENLSILANNKALNMTFTPYGIKQTAYED